MESTPLDFEDRCVQELLLRQGRVSGLFYPLVSLRLGALIGMSLILLNMWGALTIHYLVPEKVVLNTMEFVPPVLALMASPLSAVLGMAFLGWMLYLLSGQTERRLDAAAIMLQHIHGLYETIASEPEGSFERRMLAVFRREIEGVPFHQSLFAERLSVPPAFDAKEYPVACDISSRLEPLLALAGNIFCIGLLQSLAIQLAAVTAYLWVWLS